MASNTSMHSDDPPKANTTFVQADPSNFRAVVQKLTGAEKLPLATQTHKPINTTKKSNFKLQERAKKLEMNIGVSERAMFFSVSMSPSPEMVMVSPVSPLEVLAREEEEKAIAEKGFYLHPSPKACDPPSCYPCFHCILQHKTKHLILSSYI